MEIRFFFFLFCLELILEIYRKENEEERRRKSFWGEKRLELEFEMIVCWPGLIDDLIHNCKKWFKAKQLYLNPSIFQPLSLLTYANMPWESGSSCIFVNVKIFQNRCVLSRRNAGMQINQGYAATIPLSCPCTFTNLS